MKFTKAVMRYVWGYKNTVIYYGIFFFALFMAVAASSGR